MIDDHVFFSMARGSLDPGDKVTFAHDEWSAVVPWWWKSDYKRPEDWFMEYADMYGLDAKYDGGSIVVWLSKASVA